MKNYVKTRYKTYANVAIGILIGFIIVTFLFDRPDYTSAIIALTIGLFIGELFVFSRWLKNKKTTK